MAACCHRQSTTALHRPGYVPNRRPSGQVRSADFPRATLRTVPGAKTWVPVGNPAAVAHAIAEFVPTQVP